MRQFLKQLPLIVLKINMKIERETNKITIKVDGRSRSICCFINRQLLRSISICYKIEYLKNSYIFLNLKIHSENYRFTVKFLKKIYGKRSLNFLKSKKFFKK
jgi:hypothetical protein